LSNTCPQTGAVQCVVAARGQMSNKPKREQPFAVDPRERQDSGAQSSAAHVASGSRTDFRYLDDRNVKFRATNLVRRMSGPDFCLTQPPT